MARSEHDEKRSLPFEGIQNFRDLGGLETSGGHKVASGRLFRSGLLSRMTDRDSEYFATLNIGEVYDLRLPDEVESYPATIPGKVTTRVYGLRVIDLDTVFDAAVSSRGDFTGADTARIVAAGYAACISELSIEFGRLFTTMAAQSDQAALIHCMAGKDRTGVAVALLLSALDVTREAIVADYVRTRHHLIPEKETGRIARFLERERGKPADPDILRPLFESREDYIAATLSRLADGFGGIEGYFRDCLGLRTESRHALRHRFLG